MLTVMEVASGSPTATAVVIPAWVRKSEVSEGYSGTSIVNSIRPFPS